MFSTYNSPRQNDAITYFTCNKNNINNNNKKKKKKGNNKEIANKEIATCFQATAQLEDLQFPLWFSEGKTNLIPKPNEFRSVNQRSVTCLNNLYEWQTPCLLAQANQHIETYGLIQREQRGARGNSNTWRV